MLFDNVSAAMQVMEKVREAHSVRGDDRHMNGVEALAVED